MTNSGPYPFARNEPDDHDVLCSKDKSFANHPGNLLFREKIDSLTTRYRQCRSKTEKMQMTKEVVRDLMETFGSKFLKLEDGEWVEITLTAARDKVSHALRFAANKEAKAGKSKDSTDNKTKSSQAMESRRVNKTRSASLIPQYDPQEYRRRRSSLRIMEKLAALTPHSKENEPVTHSLEDVYQSQASSLLDSIAVAEDGCERILCSQPLTLPRSSIRMDAPLPTSLIAQITDDSFQPVPIASENDLLNHTDIPLEADFALFDEKELELLSDDEPVMQYNSDYQQMIRVHAA